MSIMAFMICSTKVASFTIWICRVSSHAVRVPTRSTSKPSQRKAANEHGSDGHPAEDDAREEIPSEWFHDCFATS